MTTLTNQPDTDILNEGQVAEIEAREWRYPYSDTRRGIVLTVAERDALCRTLRAAWAECDDLHERANKAIRRLRNEQETLGEAYDKLDAENAALREQLAQSQELAETRSDLIAAKAAHVDQLQFRLAQVEKERDEAQRKLMRRCTHPNTYPLKEATRRCHDCGAEILL